MSRRLGHYVVAGALVAGGLVWAASDAWPWRRPLTARPQVVDAAYVDFTETLPEGQNYLQWMSANVDHIEKALQP